MFMFLKLKKYKYNLRMPSVCKWFSKASLSFVSIVMGTKFYTKLFSQKFENC